MSGAQLGLFGQAQAYEAASDWKVKWEDAIRALAALPGQEFTSENIRQIAGDPADHSNAAGAIFSKLSREGVIRSVGFVESERPSLHGHVLRVWRGA